MIKLSDILEVLSLIESRTLRIPTHIAIGEKSLTSLVNQYNDMVNSDADSVFQVGEKKYDEYDLEGFFGVKIVISKNMKDEFKVLEEITPYS